MGEMDLPPAWPVAVQLSSLASRILGFESTEQCIGRTIDSSFLLLRALDLCPCVAQRHRAIEDQPSGFAVEIDAEITQALELEAIAGFHRRQTRLDIAVRQRQERLR